MYEAYIRQIKKRRGIEIKEAGTSDFEWVFVGLAIALVVAVGLLIFDLISHSIYEVLK